MSSDQSEQGRSQLLPPRLRLLSLLPRPAAISTITTHEQRPRPSLSSARTDAEAAFPEDANRICLRPQDKREDVAGRNDCFLAEGTARNWSEEDETLMVKTPIVRESLQMKTDRRRRDGWQRARLTVPPTEGGADERGPERRPRAKGMRARVVRVERLRWGRRARRAGGRAESGIGARRRRPDERPKKVGQIR